MIEEEFPAAEWPSYYSNRALLFVDLLRSVIARLFCYLPIRFKRDFHWPDTVYLSITGGGLNEWWVSPPPIPQ